MRSKQDGLTLLEVLAAVTILSFVVMMAYYVFTQNYEFSHKEEQRDVSVNIARAVIEEMRGPFKAGSTTASIQLNHDPSAGGGASPLAIDLTRLRDNNTANPLPPMQHVDTEGQTYIITINDLTIGPDKNIQINDDNGNAYTFPTADHFALIQVTVVNELFNTKYELQVYLEKN